VIMEISWVFLILVLHAQYEKHNGAPDDANQQYA